MARHGQNRRAEGALKPEPVSLADGELDLEHQRVVEARNAVPVEAWVPMALDVTPIRVSGVAVRWTDRAVEVEWSSGDGEIKRAWVWAAACDRVER